VAYDTLLERDGHQMLYLPFLNYSGFDFEPIRECCSIRGPSSASPTGARAAASPCQRHLPAHALGA
jgi:hypothetical protein